MNNIKLTNYFTEPKEKYNILSCVVFLISESYKNINIYYEGLALLPKITRQYLKEYYIRIYYDDSVIKPIHNDKRINDAIINKWAPLIESLKQDPIVQLVHYEHPDFMMKGLHDGLFGTLVRFIPLFDYDFNKNIDTIIITDIDIKDDRLHIELVESLAFMDKNYIKFHYSSNLCYAARPRFNLITDEELEKNPYTLLAPGIISKIKFPNNMLEDFISNVRSLECNVKKFIESARYDMFNNYEINKTATFVYGIDEFFLAKYISKYIIDNKIPFSLLIVPDNCYKVLYIWYLNSDMFKDEALFAPLLKQILGPMYNIKKSARSNFWVLKKKRDLEPIKNIVRKLKENGEYVKYNFSNRQVNCILNNCNKKKYLKSKI